MRRSYLWAALFALAIGGWLASGQLLPGESGDPAPTETPRSASGSEVPFWVQAATFTAEPRTARIAVRGFTEASKRIEVRARTSGIIEESPFSQGDAVSQGDVLCRLDMAGRKAQLEQAKAQLRSAEHDYDAARKLKEQDFVSESKLAAERARLDLAKAQLDQIEWDVGWTEIKAPAAGVLTEKPAEAGSYLEPGSVCATLAALDPILVVAQVSEHDIAAVQLGMRAQARLVTGETVEGKVRFIAPSADLATRTFRVELEVANPGHRLREGVTAELMIDLPPQIAHKVPSSALILNDKGEFGLRLVEDGSRARFTPVKLIAQERDGAWVTGLPDEVTIITVGQDFVTDGQLVEPVMQTAETR